ncbi:Hint domain-containing protein [Thetidibacter halocola]|uniref:Hint domain-containing protein n=1 Tax=Thetidibacter halocola TaxID=2827239 RepID=A0A8J8B9T5_9RHOB|nr:Hint domain-containing protein [Thetidibacter halocola]
MDQSDLQTTKPEFIPSIGSRVAAQDSRVEDQNAGFSHRYDSCTDSDQNQAVAVTCFAAGTAIAVPGGRQAVETLRPGDLVETLDHCPRPDRIVMKRNLDFRTGTVSSHEPIAIRPHSIAPEQPDRLLRVSPQHRLLVRDARGAERLVAAKGLIDLAGVRVMAGCRQITHLQLVFDRHEVLRAENCWTERFYPSALSIANAPARFQRALFQL